jgi:ABC-2 type transport system permease protein
MGRALTSPGAPVLSTASACRLLFRLRFRAYRNGVGAATPAQKWVGALLSGGGALLFVTILLAFVGLLTQARSVQGAPGVRVLIGETCEYLFLFLLAGAIPFVSGVLFSPGDLSLLAGAPIRPVALVAGRLFDAVVASSAQMVVIGVPLLVACGVSLRFGPGAWLGFVFLLALFLALPCFSVAALLLLLARVFGLRHVRIAVAAASAVLSVGLCLLMVSTLSSRASHGGGVFSGPPTVAETHLPPYLPSAWMADAIVALGESSPPAAVPFALLFGATALVTAACLLLGGKILVGESLLEGDSGSSGGGAAARIDRLLALLPLAAPVRTIMGRDFRYIARDLVLLSQIGIPLILFLVPFAIGAQLQTGGSAVDSDMAVLTLGTVGMIAYMETSILGLSSIGLEGRSFYLILSAPVTAGQLVRAKWLGAYAASLALTLPLFTITVLYYRLGIAAFGGGALALAVACAALCGLGVGISGLFPRFIYENPAHRASIAALIWGFVGSTAYLLLAGMTIGGAFYVAGQWPEAARNLMAGGVGAFVVLSALTGIVPLVVCTARLRGYAWEE